MRLIQILLPLADNDGMPFSQTLLRGFERELAERFGGVTAYSRAPAKGVWNHDGSRQRDDVIILEIMTAALDIIWWQGFRRRLESILRQDRIVIRAQSIELL